MCVFSTVTTRMQKHRPPPFDPCVVHAGRIGDGTVMEFCSLPQQSWTEIGEHCLVSGLRNQSPTAPLRIPDNTCVQMMPLLSNDNKESSRFVIMALGVNDPIKKSVAESTLFGVPLESFLRWTGLQPNDLWDANTSQTIWNAKLHPILDDDSFADLWNWIPSFQSGSPPPASLERWKQQPRLSLCQVRDQSDAAAERPVPNDTLCME